MLNILRIFLEYNPWIPISELYSIFSRFSHNFFAESGPFFSKLLTDLYASSAWYTLFRS